MTTVVDHPPASGTREYEWWSAGAHAEAAIRREGRTKHGLEITQFVDGLAEHWHHLDGPEIVAFAFSVYTADLPLRKRLLLLWRYRALRPRQPRRVRAALLALRRRPS